MINIGLCKYSGGGFRLTDYGNHKEGFFDVTIIEQIKLIKVLLNIKKLFNGNLRKLKEVTLSKNKVIIIKNRDTHLPYIQADGELLGKGNAEFTVINNAIKFIVGQKN
jgi:diacylglycerol kinase family enzyme